MNHITTPNFGEKNPVLKHTRNCKPHESRKSHENQKNQGQDSFVNLLTCSKIFKQNCKSFI